MFVAGSALFGAPDVAAIADLDQYVDETKLRIGAITQETHAAIETSAAAAAATGTASTSARASAVGAREEMTLRFGGITRPPGRSCR